MGKNLNINPPVQKERGTVEKIKAPGWLHILNNVKKAINNEKILDKDLIIDCQTSMAYRLYKIGMGTVTPGFHEVTAITFLLEKSVLETENIHNLLDDKEEINNLDSPVGVNNLACRIVTLFLEGYISARTAENTLDMLKQKITFSETAYLLPHFDEYKKEIREGLKALPHGKKNSTQKKD